MKKSPKPIGFTFVKAPIKEGCVIGRLDDTHLFVHVGCLPEFFDARCRPDQGAALVSVTYKAVNTAPSFIWESGSPICVVCKKKLLNITSDR